MQGGIQWEGDGTSGHVAQRHGGPPRSGADSRAESGERGGGCKRCRWKRATITEVDV